MKNCPNIFQSTLLQWDTVFSTIQLINSSLRCVQSRSFCILHLIVKILEVEKNSATDFEGMHGKICCPLDSIYGLENIDFIYLKVLGHHHKQFSNQEDMTGFGLRYGGCFCPVLESSVEQSGFAPDPSDNEEVDESLSSDHSEEEQKKAHDSFTMILSLKMMMVLD